MSVYYWGNVCTENDISGMKGPLIVAEIWIQKYGADQYNDISNLGEYTAILFEGPVGKPLIFGTWSIYWGRKL